MNSTNVPSNQKVTSKIVATGFFVTEERNLEVPQDAKKLDNGITSYIEEQGNIEIVAGKGFVNKNGEMFLGNGDKLEVSQEDIKTLAKNKEEREKKNEKLAQIEAEEKSNIKASVEMR